MSTATKAASDFTQIFDTAISAFGDSVKAGVKGHEELVKFWSGALSNGALEEWQKRSKAVLDRTTPAVQKSAEEWVKLVEVSYKRNVDLLKKAVETEGGTTVADVQARTQKVWQAAVETVKENAQAAAQANVRTAELWSDVMKKNVEQAQSYITGALAAAKTN